MNRDKLLASRSGLFIPGKGSPDTHYTSWLQIMWAIT